MKVKKMVILSDSLGRPRPDITSYEASEYEDTYGYLLREKLGPDWIVDICYIESLDTLDGIFWSERMVSFRRPDVAILHIGVNDCAPRVFKKNSSPFIYNPIFKKLTGNFFGRVVNRLRRQLTWLRRLVYVSPEKYIENLSKMKESILKYSPNCQVVFISIAKTSAENDKRSYGYNHNISLYNSKLHQAFPESVVDVNLLSEKLLISDGIHLSKSSHRQLADALFDKLPK